MAEANSSRPCVICDGPVPLRQPGQRGRPRITCSDTCSLERARFVNLERYKRRYAAGDRRDPRASYRHEKTCPVCGVAFLGKAAQAACSRACAFEAQVIHGARRRGQPRKSEFRKRAERLAKKAAAGSSGGRSVWVQGPCATCGQDFTSVGAAARFCSAMCRPKRKTIKRSVRRALLERDAFTCQLCFEVVDRDAHPGAPLYPALDHVVPRSKGGSDDVSNLRTAHNFCNARKSDMTLSEFRTKFPNIQSLIEAKRSEVALAA